MCEFCGDAGKCIICGYEHPVLADNKTERELAAIQQRLDAAWAAKPRLRASVRRDVSKPESFGF